MCGMSALGAAVPVILVLAVPYMICHAIKETCSKLIYGNQKHAKPSSNGMFGQKHEDIRQNNLEPCPSLQKV